MSKNYEFRTGQLQRYNFQRVVIATIRKARNTLAVGQGTTEPEATDDLVKHLDEVIDTATAARDELRKSKTPVT